MRLIEMMNLRMIYSTLDQLRCNGICPYLFKEYICEMQYLELLFVEELGNFHKSQEVVIKLC